MRGQSGWRPVLGIMLALTVWGGVARATQATLVADAHVNSALPGVNSGTLSNVYVGSGYSGLLEFDLSPLPAGTSAAQVAHATLRLYCNRVDTSGAVTVAPVSAAWGEYSVTYASLPTTGSAIGSLQVTQAGAFYTLDVTSTVQGWVSSPTTNNGLALTAASAAVQFDSKENDLTAHPAELDITLVSQGPTGAQGPAGPQGPAGVQGSAGAPGAAGANGAAGAPGPIGPQGLMGPQGPAGPVGAAGPQGPAGVPGAAGATGPVGPAGATGPAGPAGPAGATGPQGPPVSFQGVWQAGPVYSVGDAVSSNGSSYIALSINTGLLPAVNPQAWALLAQAGATGPTGAAGAVGPQGPPGVAGPQGLAGATGAAGPAGPTGPAGASGPVGPQGPAGPAGPAGATGPVGPAGPTGSAGVQGPQGPAGAPGINYRGAWSSLAGYVLNDAVSYNGATYLAVQGSTGSQPDQSPAAWSVLAAAGATGPSGPTGQAATITVGTVTTGAAGTQASVTNSGSATAAILNFTIPQGATGASGGSGTSTGPAAGNFLSMYHGVSYNASYYAVNSPNGSGTEDVTVLTWVPAACTATLLSVYSLQSNPITVTLRVGVLGAMSATTLACTASSGGTCTATGTVPVAASQFVDLGIAGSSGTTAGVWTALSCS
ncbi:MAG: collagen-like protein [Acidobacteriota bacterium]|nr:collagen-like protein [Acidobacteriota bacterium]